MSADAELDEETRCDSGGWGGAFRERGRSLAGAFSVWNIPSALNDGEMWRRSAGFTGSRIQADSCEASAREDASWGAFDGIRARWAEEQRFVSAASLWRSRAVGPLGGDVRPGSLALETIA